MTKHNTLETLVQIFSLKKQQSCFTYFDLGAIQNVYKALATK